MTSERAKPASLCQGGQTPELLEQRQPSDSVTATVLHVASLRAELSLQKTGPAEPGDTGRGRNRRMAAISETAAVTLRLVRAVVELAVAAWVVALWEVSTRTARTPSEGLGLPPAALQDTQYCPDLARHRTARSASTGQTEKPLSHRTPKAFTKGATQHPYCGGPLPFDLAHFTHHTPGRRHAVGPGHREWLPTEEKRQAAPETVGIYPAGSALQHRAQAPDRHSQIPAHGGPRAFNFCTHGGLAPITFHTLLLKKQSGCSRTQDGSRPWAQLLGQLSAVICTRSGEGPATLSRDHPGRSAGSSVST
ncbi:hypothetical protein TREES_T100003903 [Tupaia chinensis]|uniref:Uncharacterized protein n=1 Tax=Tupaia chinensis TaxID=246437 RepID=L9KZH3_TUPCH|nr:hypothetical protein TREES_T100003903 [Tupaia chinensis]